MNWTQRIFIQKEPLRWFPGIFIAAVFILGSTPLHAKEKYKEVEVTNGGTIRGMAKWKGDIPKLPPITVFKHMDKCGQTVVNPALVVNPENKGVKFVAIYLKEEIAEGKPLPDEKEKIKRDSPRVLHAGKDKEQRPDSALCNFEEHVFGFVRTRKVGFYNMENLLHNPHAFGDNGATLFNIPLPDPNRMSQKQLKRVKGVNRIQCDTHIHMNGWMLGFSHPYYSITDHKGQFEISQIPPGKYTLVAWHEGYNIKEFAADNRPVYDEPHIFEQAVEIKAGETIELNFEFPARDVTVEYKVVERTVEGH